MKIARYRQIHEQLRTQILAGAYRPGDRLPTEMELAAQHGVSRVTSAAALAALAREGLVQRVPRRGTIVADMARPTPTEHRPLIAWIQPEVDPTFSMGLLRGIEYAARQAGYNLLFHLTGASREEEERAIRTAVAAGASGLALFLQDGETYNGEVLRLVLDKYPLVLVDRYLRGLECASVQSDNILGACQLTAQLVAAGHRRICALVFPPKDTSTIEDRLEGYAQALAAAGIPLDRSLIYVEDELPYLPATGEVPEHIVERFAEYLRRRSDVTAIFASNAGVALLAVRAIERLGRRIPEDLSVVSIDAVETFPIYIAPLTCVLQQAFEIGKTAISLIQEQLAGAPPRRVMLPMRIVDAGTIATTRLSAR